MNLDPSRFYLFNVTDSCAVQNILSSRLLYTTAISAGCLFSCTHFVYYECLLKPRKTDTLEDQEIRKRLSQAMRSGQFRTYHLDLEDLQDIEVLEQRRNLGKGELSSIAFAKKTRQAFLTDDQKARKLATFMLETSMIQTTPHLLGWLFFKGLLVDQDKDIIILEHEQLEKRIRLTPHFQTLYYRALEFRLAYRQS